MIIELTIKIKTKNPNTPPNTSMMLMLAETKNIMTQSVIIVNYITFYKTYNVNHLMKLLLTTLRINLSAKFHSFQLPITS